MQIEGGPKGSINLANDTQKNIGINIGNVGMGIVGDYKSNC